MKFLNKLVAVVGVVLNTFTGFAPVVRQTFPEAGGVVDVISHDLAAIADVVTNVDLEVSALTDVTLTGAQKLVMSIEPVTNIIMSSALLSGRKIGNQALLEQGIEKVTSGMADIVNSLHEDEVKKLVVTSKT